MDFGKCSKSAKEDCSCCPLFSSLCFSSLQCSFLAYFERLRERTMKLQILVLHEFELPKALPWTIYSSPSISDCFGDKKAIKTPKLNTNWLELIARVLNMLIRLKGNNYYSKVFKRVNYKLSNSTFWVVIIPLDKMWTMSLWDTGDHSQKSARSTILYGMCRASAMCLASRIPWRPSILKWMVVVLRTPWVVIDW